MTLFFHELKRSRLPLTIWSAAISFMLAVCIVIFPEMSKEMGEYTTNMFSDLGTFSEAFNLDKLDFSRFMDYFGIECANVLGLGGAFFAALGGISMLSKEQKDNTADFLLTHPISRTSVVTQKLLALFTEVFILNAVVFAVSYVAIVIIGEQVKMTTLILIFLSFLILQLEIASVTFSISAFLKGNGIGIGLGLALMLYFFNIIANITEGTEFLRYVTPYAYADSAYIIKNIAIEIKYLIIGAIITIAAVITAFTKYRKKDIC